MSDTVFQDTKEMNVLFVHSMLDDAGLSPYEFRVYCHLARRANKMGVAFPGMISMAKTCKFSESQTKRSIKVLEERGMLIVQRTEGGLRGASNRYILTPPSSWKDRVLVEPGHNRDAEPGSGRTAKEIQDEGNPPNESGPTSDPVGFTPVTIRNLWNSLCPSLPRITEITASRMKHARARCGENLTLLTQAFERAEASDFISGRRDGAKKWANFDWLMKPDNWTKLMEGRYDNRERRVDEMTSVSHNVF